jgi:hypothetical protein
VQAAQCIGNGHATGTHLRERTGEDIGPAAKVGEPEPEDTQVEEQGQRERHVEGANADRDADGAGQEDVDRILGVPQPVAEAHRRHDAGEAEREGQARLHQHHDPGHHQRQHDEGLRDAFVEGLRLLLGLDVDDGDREHEDDRHHHGDGGGEAKQSERGCDRGFSRLGHAAKGFREAGAGHLAEPLVTAEGQGGDDAVIHREEQERPVEEPAPAAQGRVEFREFRGDHGQVGCFRE